MRTSENKGKAPTTMIIQENRNVTQHPAIWGSGVDDRYLNKVTTSAAYHSATSESNTMDACTCIHWFSLAHRRRVLLIDKSQFPLYKSGWQWNNGPVPCPDELDFTPQTTPLNSYRSFFGGGITFYNAP